MTKENWFWTVRTIELSPRWKSKLFKWSIGIWKKSKKEKKAHLFLPINTHTPHNTDTFSSALSSGSLSWEGEGRHWIDEIREPNHDFSHALKWKWDKRISNTGSLSLSQPHLISFFYFIFLKRHLSDLTLIFSRKRKNLKKKKIKTSLFFLFFYYFLFFLCLVVLLIIFTLV